MVLKYFSIFLSFLFIFAFLKPISTLSNTYYFQDEFNEERAPNTLNASKWNLYPNSTLETRIREIGGNVQLQSGISNIFPYVVSKTNPFPATGDFTLEFGIQYTSVVQRGNGLVVSLTPPENNINELDKDNSEVYFFGVWQGSDKGFEVTYDGYCAPRLPCNQPGVNIYNKPSPDLSYHKVKLIYSSSVYEVYVDGNKMFASPPTTNRPRVIWFGNPTNQYSNATWSSFKIDYIRITTLPTPFLDLPWDYEGKGLSFNEAALAINSFFDHQYPLLSRGRDLAEPATASANIVNFMGQTTTDAYSKHDGYDWGNTAKAKLNDSVLAAASGSATYINSCSSCGNMIVVDHGNNYQTRYMHLQKDDLITDIPNQPTPVSNRQQIGKVGFSGNVRPNDERGAHIHFGVFQDKNGDGNFNDNEPDGVTDPFGWQSYTIDPWPSYNFNYLGQNRTGNKSYYLWRENLINTASAVTPAGATLNAGNYTLTFPQNATTQNLLISAKSAPTAKTSNNLVSVGSTLLIKALDLLGNPVTQILGLYNIALDFSNLDISKLKADTLSFYSSQDGLVWNKEDTTFPASTQAQIQLNHFSYFALMGERRDTTPPTTTAILSGSNGQPAWFRSDVQLALNAQDNEDGLGVDYTLYQVNKGETQVYSSPLDFTQEGHYKVQFYSADEDDNIEEVKSVEFDIDKTLPEGRIYLDEEKMDLAVIGLDTNQTTVNTQAGKKDIKVYQITDQAGNTLKLDAREFDKAKKDKFIVYSLKYNEGETIYLPKNQYLIEYGIHLKKPIRLIQKFVMKDQVRIKIRYNARLNKSEIYLVNAEKEKLKETRDGLIILSLATKNGNLEYSY